MSTYENWANRAVINIPFPIGINDNRPKMFCISLVSGWNAFSQTCCAYNILASVIVFVGIFRHL